MGRKVEMLFLFSWGWQRGHAWDRIRLFDNPQAIREHLENLYEKGKEKRKGAKNFWGTDAPYKSDFKHFLHTFPWRVSIIEINDTKKVKDLKKEDVL